MTAGGSILGNAVLRLEDPTLLTGGGKYLDDLLPADVVRLGFVRSPMAHGMLRSVDVSAARVMPGVVAVYHAEGDDLALAPFRGSPIVPAAFNRPVFARGRVRFVGDILAAVVAASRADAADAAEAIVIDIDPLPVVVSQATATSSVATLLFPDAGTNVCFATSCGGTADPLHSAEVVVELDMVSQRLAGVPMETNGCMMVPDDPPGGITCWISHQTPHSLRPALAAALGLKPEAVRVVCPRVGGGFGPKSVMYVEYLVVAAAAMQLGRPVRWTETRSEDMVALVHGRDYIMNARLGLTNFGRITGLDATVVASAGAYPAFGAVLPTLTQLMATGVYDIPRVRFKATSVVTNTTPVGPYRGAGRPEATQLIERVLDVAAHQLKIDPADIRRLNFIDPARFPFATVTGAVYDSGDYGKALDAALEAAGYDELRAEQARRRVVGEEPQLGIGLSTYVEVTAPLGFHTEYGAVEIHDDGSVSVAVGTSSHGQGHHTAFAMVASDVLGIPMDKIQLIESDTSVVPRGSGTLGSRSLQTAGNAVLAASKEVLIRAQRIAAHQLEASPSDIITTKNGLHVAGVPDLILSWQNIVAASRDASRLPEGLTPGPLRHEGDFDGAGPTYPFGAHVSVVDVDTETGKVTMRRHIAVDDCGRILNPLLVRGQQHGGIAQGAAQALFEWVQYDQEGNPLTTNLMDYTIPAASEFPSFEVSNTETDSPRNPLGAKGIGESGTIGSTPAVQNAVVDAVSHLGVVHVDMPCTPERVWRAIRSARS
jgi:aerobic carbon-monoxide dehydrogenase large subunit